jgi:tetratricopeptide (TPR) repeat protein
MKTRFYQTCLVISLSLIAIHLNAQLLRLPDPNVTNLKCSVGRTVGVTDIEIRYNAPAVRGRENKIYGTNVVPYGYNVLGFGSDMPSPWRAGANESTTISFSTDVTVNGKKLAAGKYGFFIVMGPDSCELIFNKNTAGWGAYFFDKSLDVLHVFTKPVKNQPMSKERLEYTFSNQTDRAADVALEWEYWKIPFRVETDIINTTLASIRTQMSGAMGFDTQSLQAAAAWCLQNNINLDQATTWITTATDPNLGGVRSFAALATKSGLLEKSGKKEEADKTMQAGLEIASALELHQYGRQLLAQKKIKEALEIFDKNYKKNDGKWPTAVGMMRGLSANGNIVEALKYAKIALTQAPDDVNKRNLEASIKTLESGKPL